METQTSTQSRTSLTDEHTFPANCYRQLYSFVDSIHLFSTPQHRSHEYVKHVSLHTYQTHLHDSGHFLTSEGSCLIFYR